eukprot:m.220670 g.220670  ORF g.220670 m.220670 type:complete len:138 (+) comp15624_c0_seq1:57-470(+)
MSDSCTRCQKAIFAAEQPVRVPGGVYHDACFKCKACGTKLTLKTQTTKEGAVWCKSHIPSDTPDQGMDVTTAGQLGAPKQHMGARTITEKAGGQGSSYGAGAVAVEGAKNAPKPPTTVNQINKMEVLHQGVERFTSN